VLLQCIPPKQGPPSADHPFLCIAANRSEAKQVGPAQGEDPRRPLPRALRVSAVVHGDAAARPYQLVPAVCENRDGQIL